MTVTIESMVQEMFADTKESLVGPEKAPSKSITNSSPNYITFKTPPQIKQDLQREILEKDVIPYRPYILKMVDGNGEVHELYSYDKDETIDFFGRQGLLPIAILDNPDYKFPREVLAERKRQEDIKWLHENGYVTFYPVDGEF